MSAIGVDIGGTSIKVAPVDLETGRLSRTAARAPTPRPATPHALVEVVADLVGKTMQPATVGVGFPGVVRDGVVSTAANLDLSWVGRDVGSMLSDRLDVRWVAAINDADAAGLAEMRLGSGRDAQGVVVTVTLGTGIGTAVFNDGALVPNSEYGHLMIDGTEAEALASGQARNSLSWEHWVRHLEIVLRRLERLVWPDLFIIGGGISAEFQRFCASLDTETPVVAAAMGNDAGIVGAALAGAT
jgi:polyphosphate glucokinase